MKHRTKLIKFHSGKDSNKMILRKMMTNFFMNSHIVTTEKRGKIIKRFLDIVVSKTREEKESNKNYLLKYFPSKVFVATLFAQVGPAVKHIVGGYVRIVRMNQRDNDGAMMVRVEWAHPVVINWEGKKPEKTKTEKKATPKKAVKKEKTPAKEEKKVTEKEQTK